MNIVHDNYRPSFGFIANLMILGFMFVGTNSGTECHRLLWQKGEGNDCGSSFTARRDRDSKLPLRFKKWKFSVANRYRQRGGWGGGVLGLGNKIYHGNCVAQHPRVRTVTSIMIILWMAERTGGVKARLAGESPPRS